MRIGIFITARLDSIRLPQKHLKEVNGRPIIQCLIDRINAEFAYEIAHYQAAVVMVTGNVWANKELEERTTDCRVFYGDDCNIPLRHAQASNGFDAILNVDGDDTLCSRQAMRLIFNELAGGAEYVTTEGLPVGMNAFGYSTAFLKKSLPEGEHLIETGWQRIFDASALKTIALECDNAGRFTLDYQEDYDFLKAVICGMDSGIVDATHDQIIAFVKSHSLKGINWYRSQEYFDEFNRRRTAEAQSMEVE